MTEEIKLLIVEDVATDAELTVRELSRAGLSCKVVHDSFDPVLQTGHPGACWDDNHLQQ